MADFSPAQPYNVKVIDPTAILAASDQQLQGKLALDYTRATQADRIAAYQDAAQTQQVNGAAQREVSQLQTQTSRNARLAQIMAAPTNAQEWDDALQEAVDDGIPEARQYIGRYNPERQSDWIAGLSASTPGQALNGYQGNATPTSSPLAGLGPGGGGGGGIGSDPDLVNRLARLSPQERAATQQRVSAIRQAITAVEQSPNPQQTFNQQVVQLGHPEWVNQPWQQRVAQVKAQVVPLDNTLAALNLQGNLGVPLPQPAAKLEHVGGGVVSVEGDPAHPTARVLYDNPNGAGGRASVFAQKRQAWLDVHPNDDQGALNYASGKGKQGMSTADMRKSADAQATRDLQAATLSGATISDPQAYLRQQSEMHFSELQDAGAADQRSAGGSGAGGFRSNGYAAPSAQAIATLRQNPSSWRYFDRHFGPGSASHILNPKKYGALQ